MGEPRPEPKVDWHPFGGISLVDRLQLRAPPFTSAREAFRQLRYVADYAADLKCKTIAIESHYIDRDYMEDHSVFYSKTLFSYKNSCRRIHFFSLPEDEVENALNAIVEAAIHEGPDVYRRKCKQLSDNAYLGFAVVKPLDGSPVGRTVLRCHSEVPDDPQKRSQFRRNFSCARTYRAHLYGVELSVRGLAFQQQDIGVSACATTAVWSALQKAGDHEEISAATPAQITTLAARYSLPFGRSMPSEGLNVDQMCQAIQACGLAPNLFRVGEANVGRAFLYSALKSAFAPVLLLESSGRRHAVAVVGMKTALLHTRKELATNIDDSANDLIELYIHDDRFGPYLRAELATKDIAQKGPPQKQLLELTIPHRQTGSLNSDKEAWQITHVLVPMHGKIRLSFSGLRFVALRVASAALRYRVAFEIAPSLIPDPTITIDTWIIRAHKYIESLILDQQAAVAGRASKISTTISLARYVGVVRLVASYFDPIDVIVDSTNTLRNAHCLGVLVAGSSTGHTALIAEHLGQALNCPTVI